MNDNIISQIDWKKCGNLVPCIVQDNSTRQVLMMGYMNKEAIQITFEKQKLVFFSRTKSRLWMKGEKSGNFLQLIDLSLDCDNDTILAKVNPQGPVCHTGNDTCWNEKNESTDFLQNLQKLIHSRKINSTKHSYTSSLFEKGINKIAQKVGEEAVELIIEAKDNNENLFLNEAADLMYHYLVLLSAKELDINDVIQVLKNRNI